MKAVTMVAMSMVSSAVVSLGVSVAVLYWAPGYAPSPKEVIFATNANTNAITKVSQSVLEVVKRLNEIAPPEKNPSKDGRKNHAQEH